MRSRCSTGIGGHTEERRYSLYEGVRYSRASGVYFYRLETSDFVQARKMVLMK